MRAVLPLALLALLSGCGRVSQKQAHELVTHYNSVVSEAYRKGDVRLIDEVVGPNAPDGKRLTGLIGVRSDMGIVLDAHLDSLVVTGIKETPGGLEVGTKERWNYRDLKAGTTIQVGEASVDHYEMTYLFKNHAGRWLVEETRFASPPQVGRKEAPWSMEARDAHGMIPPSAAQERKP